VAVATKKANETSYLKLCSLDISVKSVFLEEELDPSISLGLDSRKALNSTGSGTNDLAINPIFIPSANLQPLFSETSDRTPPKLTE